MYAIVNISGKQYKAEKGVKLCVPKQSLDEGKKLVLEDVLMVHDGKTTKFGNPKVSGAKVTATVIDHGRERKILVYKKKRRKGYQRKNGHRQWYTNIEIQNIQMSKPKSAPKPKKEKKRELNLMAHKKGQGSSRNGRDSNAKYLGLKVGNGQSILAGTIILKQRGTKIHPGSNVKRANDDSLFATKDGIVEFRRKGRDRKIVNIV